jgi:hypothetical protein
MSADGGSGTSWQSLAYIYSRKTESEAMRAGTLTEDEARRDAANIARLSETLRQGGQDE